MKVIAELGKFAIKTRNRALLNSLIISCTTLACQTGHSNTVNQGLLNLSLEELLSIQVTGSTQTSESLSQVPAAVTVFSRAQIKALGFDSLNELMGLVPGFQSYRSAQSSYHHPFSSRGRRIDSSSAEILVLVDGHRMNEAQSGGLSHPSTNIPLTNIERIEFIRGPGSAVYGSNAMMGIINIVTVSEHNELHLKLGNNSHTKSELLTSLNRGNFNFDLFATFTNDGGQTFTTEDRITQQDIDTNDAYSIADLHMKLNWRDTYIAARTHRTHADDFLLANFASDLFNNHQEDTFYYLTARQNFSWDSLKSWAWLSYQHSDRVLRRSLNAQGELFYSEADPGTVANVSTSEREESELRFQLHNDWNINAKNQMQFGFEYRHYEIPENPLTFEYDGLETQRLALLPKSERDILGIYSQYQSEVSQSSHLTLGLRFDDFSGIGSQLSPRVGWIQELTENQTLKFLYGQAFRAPTESELNVSNNDSVTGSPNLKPEKVQSIDIIWMGQWKTTSINAGYFENLFDDAIIQTSNNSQLEYINSNDDNHTRGYELEFSAELSNQLIIQSTYTHITSKPELTFREASQLASVSINYNHKSWNLNLNSSYHSKRDMVTLNGERLTLDSYWHTFAKINYSAAKILETYIQFKNLGDADFTTPPSFPRSNGGTPNRGRELQLGIELHW